METPARRLLILDLDETLIYATRNALNDRQPDFCVGFYQVYKRPHLDAFLSTCQEWFSLAVWTTGSPDYAAAITGAIFSNVTQTLEFVWASDHCTRVYDAEQSEFYWRKNLSKLRHRGKWPLESVIAIDDTPQKWETAYGNLVRVRPFLGDPQDDELPLLLAYLETLRFAPTIRATEKRGWRSQI